MTLSQRLTSLNENFCEWRHDSMERGLGRKERGKEETARGQIWEDTPKSREASRARHPQSERCIGGDIVLRFCRCLHQTGATAKVLGVGTLGWGCCFPTTDTLEMPRMKLQRFHLDMSPFLCAPFFCLRSCLLTFPTLVSCEKGCLVY